ncbi:hypothetical protein [Rhodococcus sp. IEGM 1330]|uniref:hypothetical protein n=1 Tax=Rhodococcus sp. IEGM 1330 TaxID=3082225 RepID=UPI0029545DD6|nr:hypothetical protein [Rhodococcus sp. IEGM 1330]MDV8020100.1 hypothetical protein [Rhodococcus sp. IEGM 1330]
MLVIALSSVIGYQKAVAIAHRASADDSTLRDAAHANGFGDEFHRIVDPKIMAGIESFYSSQLIYRLFDGRLLASLEWQTYTTKGSSQCEYF